MMVLKFPCCLTHCLHRNLLLFTFGGCIGLAIRTVIVTGKYFTLGGCCGLGITTIVTGLPVLGLSSHAL